MLFSGAWGKVIREKTWSKKSRDTVPLTAFDTYRTLLTAVGATQHCYLHLFKYMCVPTTNHNVEKLYLGFSITKCFTVYRAKYTIYPVHPQNVRFQNVWNVRFTKRQLYKTLGLLNVRSSNVLSQNVRFQNVNTGKYNLMSVFKEIHSIHRESYLYSDGYGSESATPGIDSLIFWLITIIF